MRFTTRDGCVHTLTDGQYDGHDVVEMRYPPMIGECFESTVMGEVGVQWVLTTVVVTLSYV